MISTVIFRKTKDMAQLYIWTSPALFAFQKKNNKKRENSFKLHHYTLPAALVM